MNCTFQKIERGWQCERCAWVYPRESARPPHRECQPSHDAWEESVLDSIAVFHPDGRSEEEVRRLLAICGACPEFDRGCTRGPCGQRWGAWRKRLAEGTCERWEESGDT